LGINNKYNICYLQKAEYGYDFKLEKRIIFPLKNPKLMLPNGAKGTA